ncbi:MAG TPA: hypothetical protein VFN35_29750 [Ktedonobacteraceae bacterium]|nr:hypothetical protein [Ktedonobacteraceae bacterium]
MWVTQSIDTCLGTAGDGSLQQSTRTGSNTRWERLTNRTSIRQHDCGQREPLINDRTLDELFEPILELLNHALLALYLGQVGSPPQRLEQSRNALKGFLAVQEDLEALSKQNADLLTNTTWLLWQKETQDGLAQARQQVEQLET